MKYLYKKGVVHVTGPARSGKSRFAENFLKNLDKVAYIATYPKIEDDIEWKLRIEKHKKRRPKDWLLFENYNDINDILLNENGQYNFLIDSLGGIVFSCLDRDAKYWEKITCQFMELIFSYQKLIIIVSEQVGWGISPPSKEGNLFRDRLGSLSESISSKAEDNWLVVNGRALNLNEYSIKIE
ncbi:MULTISPECIES: bifunctional adenosylcobinamide kinase/adenosylcobinamide-phosphate guanylyltransferase [Prochlorococcus]|uniref:bifunctional adenosylcobinamide kinase/adenosylcobinamide-phosphate guanylyltransferase n=1 Tax=Prochlorococcus TaxID=1218 RepID=UPI000533796B|nr:MULTISPECIES: bifunctional adenosylcobinamide kinase/adenosylcobinamide-phosphate guanylyltransferase [Prochlorococcus]KGG12430.1 Adenosylcobinamide-phosphate guanylyltransferase [Prochlorococcus sp. MIT 0601]